MTAMARSSRPKKSLGQHFLTRDALAERIADAAALPPDAAALEIGPGRGILTKALLARAKKVIAVEADRGLYETLARDFAADIARCRLVLVEGDIRAFDLASLPPRYAVVANIPYYLTGELFRLFLTSARPPASLTFLVQKEVAERIARSKKESILSLSVKAYGAPRIAFTVPRGAFSPAPNVDSAVLSVRSISRKNFRTRAEERRFFSLLRAGFAHKRKFVRKNLADAGLPAGDIPGKARAEDLPLSAWLALARPPAAARRMSPK